MEYRLGNKVIERKLDSRDAGGSSAMRKQEFAALVGLLYSYQPLFKNCLEASERDWAFVLWCRARLEWRNTMEHKIKMYMDQIQDAQSQLRALGVHHHTKLFANDNLESNVSKEWDMMYNRLADIIVKLKILKPDTLPIEIESAIGR